MTAARLIRRPEHQPDTALWGITMPAIRSFSPSDLTHREHRTRRIPPNLFAIAFGLTGLAEAWHTAGKILGTSAAVPDVIFIVAAAVWLVVVAG
jgi:hypothetical protein